MVAPLTPRQVVRLSDNADLMHYLDFRRGEAVADLRRLDVAHDAASVLDAVRRLQLLMELKDDLIAEGQSAIKKLNER